MIEKKIAEYLKRLAVFLRSNWLGPLSHPARWIIWRVLYFMVITIPDAIMYPLRIIRHKRRLRRLVTEVKKHKHDLE